MYAQTHIDMHFATHSNTNSARIERQTMNGLSDTATSSEHRGPITELPSESSMTALDKVITCAGWVVKTSRSSWSTRNVELVPDLVVPAPQPTQVRVRVRAAGVNPADAQRTICLGMGHPDKNSNGKKNGVAMKQNVEQPMTPATVTATPVLRQSVVPRFVFPHRCGLDGAGEVESVGSAVTEFKVGDRVVFMTDITQGDSGSFAQYVTTEADTVCKLPDGLKTLNFAEAAALPCASWTAYLALFDKLRVEAGRSILISGGSGGVGSTAVQLAHHFGLYVIATCSTPHVRYVQQLGADLVLDYTSVDVVAETLRRTAGFGVDYLLETAGAALAESHAEALRFGGALCVLTGTVRPSSDIFFYRQLSVHYVFLGMLHDEPLVRPQLRRIGEEVLRLYADGAFRVSVEKVPFTRANEALDVAYRCHTLGKLVLTNFHEI